MADTDVNASGQPAGGEPNPAGGPTAAQDAALSTVKKSDGAPAGKATVRPPRIIPRGVGGDDASDVSPDPTDPERGRITERPMTSEQPTEIDVAGDQPPLDPDGGSLSGRGRRRIGDRVFLGMSGGAAGLIVLIVVLVAIFLLVKSLPSILDDKVNFLTSTEWNLTTANKTTHQPAVLRFGVAALLYSTVIISLIALIIAVPIAIGIALFITQYAPKRIAQPVAYVIDLLAAIPSIVYGIWGFTTLSPKLEPVQRALYHLGGFPLFKNKGVINASLFDGGVVLAIMILPIITAISRDVFDRTPRANIEAAWALGATKWEMIRMSVLPYGRAGVTSGAMLGLGRALGETIAVYLIVSSVANFSPSIFDGGQTIASKIAGGAAEFGDAKTTGAYIAAGLVLFLLTFVVNALARWIVNRRKDFA